MNEKTSLMPKKEDMVQKSQSLSKISPVVDIYENDDEILLFADMPGVTKESISVNVDNGKMDLSGTRHLQTKGTSRWQEFGDVEYRRVFSVPQSIQIDKVNAELKDGVLILHLPKTEAAKPRTIKISAA